MLEASRKLSLLSSHAHLEPAHVRESVRQGNAVLCITPIGGSEVLQQVNGIAVLLQGLRSVTRSKCFRKIREALGERPAVRTAIRAFSRQPQTRGNGPSIVVNGTLRIRAVQQKIGEERIAVCQMIVEKDVMWILRDQGFLPLYSASQHDHAF